jgi:hypothetical protein
MIPDKPDRRSTWTVSLQDMSDLPEDKFWKNMADNELVWLHDERGNNITVRSSGPDSSP